MKTYCTLPVAAYLLRLTALATESSGHYTSKINKVPGDEAATIKERVNETRLAAGDENRPKSAQAAAAANQALASCSGDDSFTVSGRHDGTYDGCYSELAVADETWFALNGDKDGGHYFFPYDIGYGYSSWGVGTATLDEDTNTIYIDSYGACWDASYGYASNMHPTEVVTWVCDVLYSSELDQDGWSTDCGCNSAPSSSLPGAAVATAFLTLLGAKLLLVW